MSGLGFRNYIQNSQIKRMRNEICHVMKFIYFSQIHIKGNLQHEHIIKTLIPVKFCEAEGYLVTKRALFGSTVFFAGLGF